MAVVGRRCLPAVVDIRIAMRQRDSKRLAWLLGPSVILLCGWLLMQPENSPLPAPTSTNSITITAAEIRVVDGDTIEYKGINYRIMGYDTPETRSAKCKSEKVLGDQATQRLSQLIYKANLIKFNSENKRDKYGRGLGQLLIDEQDVGPLLISEGLARPYGGGPRQGWC